MFIKVQTLKSLKRADTEILILIQIFYWDKYMQLQLMAKPNIYINRYMYCFITYQYKIYIMYKSLSV